MIVHASYRRILPRVSAAATVFLLGCVGFGLGGCASMSDGMSTAFADPAKYNLYDCKQLEPERKRLANRTAELEGLMAKAETGVGGAVVSELAYRNDYISTRGQAKLAEEAWQHNNCHESPPAPAPTAPAPARPAAGKKPKPAS
jgi:hypothetical protein